MQKQPAVDESRLTKRLFDPAAPTTGTVEANVYNYSDIIINYMAGTITIPKQKYEFLIQCERIVKSIEEDHSLNEEEIKLIEKAKKGKFLTKNEFLKKIRAS